MTSSSVPVDVSGLGSGVASVHGSASHTCAVTTGAGFKCWGRNTYGEVGDAATTSRSTPVDIVWVLPTPTPTITATLIVTPTVAATGTATATTFRLVIQLVVRVADMPPAASLDRQPSPCRRLHAASRRAGDVVVRRPSVHMSGDERTPSAVGAERSVAAGARLPRWLGGQA